MTWRSKSSGKLYEFQYYIPVPRLINMQARKGDMLSRQSELPKLPVPPLKETVDKYLESVKPFLDDAEMAITMKVGVVIVAVMHLFKRCYGSPSISLSRWFNAIHCESIWIGRQSTVGWRTRRPGWSWRTATHYATRAGCLNWQLAFWMVARKCLLGLQEPTRCEFMEGTRRPLKYPVGFIEGWKYAYSTYNNIIIEWNSTQVYSSPAMAMPRRNFKDLKDQLAYSASLITAVLEFKVGRDLRK